MMDKLLQLDVHKIIPQWLSTFSSSRTQYVQIGSVISETVHINGAFHQGSLMGMEGFCVHIGYLN